MRFALACAAAAITATGAGACTYTCERDGEKDDSKCTSTDGGWGTDCCASEDWSWPSEPQTCEWGWEPTCHDGAGSEAECWRHGGGEGGCHEECNDNKCTDYLFQDCIYNDDWFVGEQPGCRDDYEPRHLAGSNPSKTYSCCRDICEGEGGGGIIVVIFIIIVIVIIIVVVVVVVMNQNQTAVVGLPPGAVGQPQPQQMAMNQQKARYAELR